MENHLHILLIDDEEDFLEITSKRLLRRGYQVSTAISCAQGMERLESASVDVIVLDVMLPDQDGIQCLRQIKERFADRPVILLTGHASMQAGLESIECGASDYCLKPVELDELVDRIEIVCRDRRGKGDNRG